MILCAVSLEVFEPYFTVSDAIHDEPFGTNKSVAGLRGKGAAQSATWGNAVMPLNFRLLFRLTHGSGYR